MSMQHAYLGESFELVFQDPEGGTVTGATYLVLAPDGSTMQSGACSVDADDKSKFCFRFNASEVGICSIKISYTMGSDAFKQVYQMAVEDF